MTLKDSQINRKLVNKLAGPDPNIQRAYYLYLKQGFSNPITNAQYSIIFGAGYRKLLTSIGNTYNYLQGTLMGRKQGKPETEREYYARLRGMAEDTAQHRLVVAQMYPTFDTTDADQLAIFTDAAELMLADAIREEPFSYDSDLASAYGKAIMLGADVLTQMKNQVSTLKLCPTLTRGDSTPGIPFTRRSMQSIIQTLKDLKVPKASYAVAELFTRFIQVGSAEPFTGTPTQYLAPFGYYNDVDELDAKIDLLGDEQAEAAVWAGYINAPLESINPNWLFSFHEVPWLSSYSNWICSTLPIRYYTGSQQYEGIDFDGSTALYYNTTIGIPDEFRASAFMRETGTSAAAGFMVGAGCSADIFSLRHWDAGDTSFQTIATSATRYDYLYNVATCQSRVQRGAFAVNANMMNYVTIAQTEAGWDKSCSRWIADHMNSSVVQLKVLTDLNPALVSDLGKKRLRWSQVDQKKYIT